MWLRQHHNLVKAGIVFGGIVLALLLAIAPLLRSTSTLSSRWKKIAKEKEELLAKVALVSQLDTNVLAERVTILDAALPPKKDILTYLAAINGLSNELGVSFGGIDLAPGVLTEATASAGKKVVKKTAGVESLESEIKINGDREKVYAFLRAIEEVLPLMQIDDVKVTVGNDGVYSLSLNLGMLWAEASVGDVKGTIQLFNEAEEKYFQQLASFRQYEPIVQSSITTTGKTDVFSPFIPQP